MQAVANTWPPMVVKRNNLVSGKVGRSSKKASCTVEKWGKMADAERQ